MRLAVGAAAISLVLVGCGSANVIAGFVIDVNSSSLTEIDSFTLRTTDGETVTFRLDKLELDDGAFPAIHLREHMALNQPVAVAFRDEGGENVAYRLKDAPWLQQ